MRAGFLQEREEVSCSMVRAAAAVAFNQRRARISPLHPTGGDGRRWRVDEVISHLIKPDLDVL